MSYRHCGFIEKISFAVHDAQFPRRTALVSDLKIAIDIAREHQMRKRDDKMPFSLFNWPAFLFVISVLFIPLRTDYGHKEQRRRIGYCRVLQKVCYGLGGLVINRIDNLYFTTSGSTIK